MGTTHTLMVLGMTCDHCVGAMTSELGALPGVTGTTVELNPGGASRVTVSADVDLDPVKLAAVVDEAGYSLA